MIDANLAAGHLSGLLLHVAPSQQHAGLSDQPRHEAVEQLGIGLVVGAPLALFHEWHSVLGGQVNQAGQPAPTALL